MNLGQNPSPQRATARKAPAHKLAGDAVFLGLRLERLCKGLQLFSRYCDQAPSEIRAAVKQYLDLAGIELADALRTLKSPIETEPADRQPAAQPTSQEVSQVEWAIQSTPSGEPSLTNRADCGIEEQDPKQGFNDPLLEPAQNGSDVHFESLAEQAEVPEANDVEAILARLKISIENTEAGEASESASRKARPSDARELLLGFEVCKLSPTESTPAQANSLHGEQAEAGSSEHSAPAAQGMNDESNSWFPSVSAELRDEIGANELKPADVSNSLPEDGQPSDESAGELSLQTGLQATARFPQASTGAAEPMLAENRVNSNSASHLRHEQSENSNPLQSISPDNLKQILELKEELNELLASYKSPQSTPSSP